jgi:Predicted membrane protein (DUF2207)
VVSMLVNGWSASVDTAESTVLDLAATHHYELRQPDADPYRTTVHLSPAPPDETALRPYERQVLDRIRGLAVDGVVPVAALAFRDVNESKAWNKRLRAAVVADARAAGLSRRRFGRTTMTALYVGAVAAGLVCSWATAHGTSTPVGAVLAFLPVAGSLAALVQHIGERDTPAGAQAASRWFGVQAWLRNHEQFAGLPPSAVAIWDRYLAYGAALGVTRCASDVLDLEVGDRRNVWSSYRGGWRRIKVRYPAAWPWSAGTTRAVVLRAVLIMAVGTVVVAVTGLTGRFSLPGYALFVGGSYVLVRAALDARWPVNVTGQVLVRRTWRSDGLDYLVIDDGTADETTAWGLPGQWRGLCHDGDIVTITARSWTRRVVGVTQHTRGQSRETTAGFGDQTGATAMDIFGEERPVRLGLLPVSVDDVARLVGRPVRTHQTPQRVEFRSAADNEVVLRAEWASGASGRLAWQLNGRGRGTPLPGIGDEAYAVGNRAVMRAGDLTFVLIAVGAGRIGIPHLPWLLSRCAPDGLQAVGQPHGTPPAGDA